MRRLFLPGLFLLAAIAPACVELEVLEPGVCGNGVVDNTKVGDVEHTEDCDGLEVDGFACRPPTVSWPCSFSCKDGACPKGYGCGVDNVCRKPTGKFQSASFAHGPSQAQELLAGDFDADGRRDIVGVEPGRIRIHFVGDTDVVQQVSISAIAPPSIGHLGALAPAKDVTVDTTDDLVIPLEIGLGALTSNGDRTFSPKTYGSITFGKVPLPFPPGEAQVLAAVPVAFDAVPGGQPHAGDETAALFTLQPTGGSTLNDGVLATFSAAGSGAAFIVPGTRPDNLSGPPVTANFDGDPCEEIVFPHFDGSAVDPSVPSTVTVFKPCVPGKLLETWDWITPDSPNSPVVAQIAAGGAVAGPAFAFDVNSDGHDDLLLTVQTEKGLRLNVAYSLGNGLFDSHDPKGPDPALGDDAASEYAVLDSVPLALGRINDDNLPDIVAGKLVRLGVPGDKEPLGFSTVYTSKRLWNEAVIGNLNADGYADVAACTKGAPDVDVLFGNGSLQETGTFLFNPLTISTDGTVAHLTVGDYDGDLVNDLVFQDMLSSQESLLVVSYGRTSGGLEEPREIGNLPDVLSIATGNVLAFGTDAISDLGVVSNVSGELSLSFFPGASSRVMQTPFLLSQDGSNEVQVPIQAGLGLLHPGSDKAAEAHDDVAVVAFAPPRVDDKLSPMEQVEKLLDAMWLWGLYGDGDAGFKTAETAKCQLPHGAFFLPSLKQATSVLVSDVPLGKVAASSYVVAPYVRLPEGGQDGIVTSLISQAHFDETVCTLDPPMILDLGQLLLHTRILDLNGNGVPEILGIESTFDPKDLAGLVSETTPGAEASMKGAQSAQLVIFWDGKLGVGQKLLPNVPDGQPKLVNDYTVGDVDGDGRPEIVVVGRGVAATYSLADDGQGLKKGPVIELDLADAGAVLLADADGDGVNDMAVASGAQLEIFRGVPKAAVTAVTKSASAPEK